MDIIVVLGSALKQGKITDELKGRLDTALGIYEDEENKKNVIFIVSGGSKTGITEAQAMAEYLISKDVPKDQIILDTEALNTIENVIYTTDMINSLRERGVIINSITYVSSEYHIPRIMKILDAFGPEDIENIYTSGSTVYPAVRIPNEEKIMKTINASINNYQKMYNL